MRLTSGSTIVVLTGAGISAESGLATFRDSSGLWEQHRVEDVATPEAFARNPDMVHRFYNQRRAQMRTVQPNAAHLSLAQMENMGHLRAIITQNIDHLHQMAGSRYVIEFHGSGHQLACMSCGERHPRQRVDLSVIPPRCAC